MPTPSEHISKSPLRGVWWVVVGLSIITLLAFAVYLIGLWLFVLGLLREVATYTVVAVSIAIVGRLAWYQGRRFFSKPQFSLRSLLLAAHRSRAVDCVLGAQVATTIVGPWHSRILSRARPH